jgi:putative transposase
MSCHIDPVDSRVAPPDQNDTDARLDTRSPATDRPTETTKTVAPTPADSTNGSSESSRLVTLEAEAQGDNLDDFVAAVTIIAQSWCERATDYTAIETLVCRLPINQWTFAAHDALAPYSGPYPVALLVREFLIEKINGWDETALHDYL